MKNLKKRLPVLILAFLIAVMPLSMAVPADASSDVLSGSSGVPGYYYIETHRAPVFYYEGVDIVSMGVPIVCCNDYPFFVLYFCLSDNVSVSSTGNGLVYLTGDWFTVECDLSVDFSSRTWSRVSSVPSDRMVLLRTYSVYNFPRSILPDNFRDVSELGISFVSPPEVGVLHVFSGVSSWLSGAVSSVLNMFYTSDGGFTVLGYLAVASLALAFILLLLYLIAGWLKFK